jgi:hypothetical protein
MAAERLLDQVAGVDRSGAQIGAELGGGGD